MEPQSADQRKLDFEPAVVTHALEAPLPVPPPDRTGAVAHPHALAVEHVDSLVQK